MSQQVFISISLNLVQVVFISVFLINAIESHGILYEPPNRASLWRFPEFAHYNVTECYTDNQISCGGIGVQYSQNGGKCGVCGDPYHLSRPRDNENGGILGQGIVARKYSTGEIIHVSVDLTSNHLGTFTFNLCPRRQKEMEEESCFDKYPLQLADGSGTIYHLPMVKMQPSGFFNMSLHLPAGVTCKYCTLRWHYRTGNTWGLCPDGSSATGCGNQEVFRNCADISIS